MRRLLTVLVGLSLIGLGGVALVGTVLFPTADVWLWRLGVNSLWRLWPVVIVGAGAALALVPLVVWRRWAGMFFIPAAPLLATGGLLLLASLANWWSVWHWAWPLEVLSIAVAFILAALYARLIWLVIPAIFVGLNGLVLQFCALTGQWNAWAVLWPVEFLAVGLTLLVVSSQARSVAVLVVGLSFCFFSGAAVAGMLVLVAGQWHLAGLLVAGGLIFLGVILLGWSVLSLRRPAAPAAVSAASSAS